MFQKQPRPPKVTERFGRYTTTSYSGGLPSYYTYNVQTFLGQLDFPFYSLTPKGQELEWNNLSGYRKIERINLPTVIPVGHKLNPNTKLHNAEQPSVPSGALDQLASSCLNKAKMKMHSEIQDGKNQLMLTFMERQKTIDMVASRAHQALSFYRAIKRNKIRKAWQVLYGKRIPKSKKASSVHLEIQYGWIQLAKEVFTLCKQPGPIQSVILRVPMTQTEHGSVAMGTKGDYEYGPCHSTWECKIRNILKIEIELDEPLLASAAQLGLTNPSFVAWDLFPPSLWIDWFLPIGSYLEQFQTLKGLKVKRFQVSETKIQTAELTDNHGAIRKTTVIDKRRYNGNLSFELRFKNPLSIMHAINALALIRTKIK